MENNLSTVLAPYFDAGYPAVAVETCEEKRLIEDCKSHWKKNGVLSIAATGGLRDEQSQKIIDSGANFIKAFGHFAGLKESLLLVFDYQHMINSPGAYRSLLQTLSSCKPRGSMVILVSPYWTMPPELKHEVPIIHLSLPSQEELKMPLEKIIKVAESQIRKDTKINRNDLASAARGLTLAEAENVFALAALEKFSVDLVEREKMKLIKSNCMSVENPVSQELLAGLGQLKSYVTDEVLPARDDDQLRVRGVLLVGVPGTGKSLSSKVIASILDWPLVRLDMSAAKGSLLGQSEANIRYALQMADAVSPCVLWFDEIEKAIGGYSSSAMTDGGATLSMVGTLLTWMQEHTSPVMVVATCNDYQKLPSELTRAGRFDERFFLDLPSNKERQEIAKVHLKRLKCEEKFAFEIEDLTSDWTGAEIEQLIKSAARRTKRNIDSETLHSCVNEIIPISRTAQVKDLRTWAQDNLRRANDVEIVAETRKLKKGVN